MAHYFGDARDAYFARRFGMFVHWGLYALPAWHEQLQWRAAVPRAQYQRLIHQFNPVRFDPDAWLDLAVAAGMRYLIFTTKHHDGFCLWATEQTDYNVMHTPYGRDIVGMLAAACQRRNFPLGFYYSVADWHHPHYPNQGRSHELPRPERGDQPDWPRYEAFLRAQVRELCARYGELAAFWWDMNVSGIVDPSINAMIRELQPNAVINNRGFDEGDFGTPERDYEGQGDEAAVYARPTEACQSVGRESWGYRAEEDYYAQRHLIASIDRTLARGGNYLLNVGPRADGTIPARSAEILRAIGAWYARVAEAFDGADPASHELANREVLATRRENTLYIHLNRPPSMERVLLKPLTAAPKRVTLLNTGAPVRWALADLPTEHMGPRGQLIARPPRTLCLRELPVDEFAGTVLVVKVEFEE